MYKIGCCRPQVALPLSPLTCQARVTGVCDLTGADKEVAAEAVKFDGCNLLTWPRSGRCLLGFDCFRGTQESD